MNIHQVKIFYMAAQTLSITNTAKKLRLSQPSVSIQIKDLEDSLNVRLFDRINRKISLTDAGKVFYDYSGKLLGLIDEINGVMSEFSGGDAGKIMIGAPNTIGNYVLPHYLGEFKDLYPKAELSLAIRNRQETIEQCLAGELDFAFIQEFPQGHSDLESLLFMRDELVCICSPKHRWAKRQEISIDEVKSENEPVILREEGSGTRDIFEGWAAKCGFDINVAMEFNNPEGIKHAVMANLGLALVSKNVIKTELEDKRLVALTVTGLNTIRDIYLVHNRKRRFMPLMEKFQEFLLLKREVDKP
jgi:DNA-binding transcriptional LysR family regulator